MSLVSELSRREALKVGALSLSGLVVPSVLTGCGGSVDTSTLKDAASSPALARFDGSRPAGPSTGLQRRVAWESTSDVEIFAALGRGMGAAARDRGLEYLTAIGSDPVTNVDQIGTFLARGVGGLAIQPLDQAAQGPVMQRALDQGVCVQGIITHPSTLQIAASQYRIGYMQGKAAADYAKAHLDGRADVVFFNLDSVSPALRLWHRGVLDGLKTAGAGVRVVSDLGGIQTSVEGEFARMTEVMQAHPEIQIVLGSDSDVVAAYRARGAGRQADRPDVPVGSQW